MPIFEVEHGGKVYEVDAPDMNAAAAAFGQPANKAPEIDPVEDAIKSIPTGAAESVIGLADIPELGARGIHAGVNAVQRLFGAEQTPRPGTTAQNFNDRFTGVTPDNPEVQPAFPLPDAKTIQSKIEGVTGQFYQPKTEYGQYGKTFGGFLPTAVSGPGGWAMRVGTQALAPTIATEAAGAATKGTRFETPARIGAAVAAGPLATRMAIGGAGRAPTAKELKKSYTDVIEDPILKNTPVPAARGTRTQTELAGPGYHIADDIPTAGLADRIRDKISDRFDPLNAPTVFKRLDYLAKLKNPTFGSVLDVRQKLRSDENAAIKAGPTGGPTADSVASGVAKREIDKFLSETDDRLRDANANYTAAKQADTLQGKRNQAHYRSLAANSGLNESNLAKSRMADILLNPKLHAGMSPTTIAQIEKINEGTTVNRAARYTSNLLGGGGGLGQSVTAGLIGGGVGYGASGGDTSTAAITAALVGGLGRGLKGVERASTRKQVNKLDELIRSQSPLAAGRPMPLANDALARALLRASAAQQPQPSYR